MTEQTKIPPATASSTLPEPVGAAAAPPDLQTRVEARRKALIAELVQLKASTQANAAEARDKIKARLSELAHIIKEGVVDGWANVGDAATTKLDGWNAK